jgi:transposase
MGAVTIGMDIAKGSVQLFGEGLKKKLYRSEVLTYFGKLEALTVALEACSGSHYWGRELAKLGHTVRLMPPQYVKPYVKRNKNDAADAEACWEAAQRPSMRFVPVKTAEQQAALQLHRERERLICERTKVVNQACGFLLEFGIALSRGVSKFAMNVREALSKHTERIPPLTSNMLDRCVGDFNRLVERIEDCEELIKTQLRNDPVAQKLDTIAGIGPIIATAARASVPDIGQFKNGRHFATSLGLVPLQASSGQTIRLGKMSKRGNPYLRKLLIQGAHAVLNTVNRKDDSHSRWLQELVRRRGRCKAAVALANKNARIMYVIMAGKAERFSPDAAHRLRENENPALGARPRGHGQEGVTMAA